MNEDVSRLHTLKPFAVCRAATLAALRHFFEAQRFMEVDTPLRIPAPALESYINAEPAGDRFLRTSPELYMKRLLASGYDRIYQVGPCFRQGEKGGLHHPEFAMLEWYRAHADYRDILADTRALLISVVREVLAGTVLTHGATRVDVSSPWIEIAVSDAYRDWAGWDPVSAFDAERFDLDMANRIEPALPKDRPVILMDYPAPAAALSRRKPGQPAVAERWELYVAGIELANAFSELTDPVEQRQRFVDCANKRLQNREPVYPLDEAFLAALENGLPPCAGIALGVDRLVMLLANADSLDQVILFRE